VTKARMSHIYRRLEADKPAYTLTGSGGGGTHVYHWKEHRALTNEERAALQTFPKSFRFCGSKEEIRKQIGMAVPTKGAKIVFEAILKTFAKTDYKSISSNDDLVFFPQSHPTPNPIDRERPTPAGDQSPDLPAFPCDTATHGGNVAQGHHSNRHRHTFRSGH